MYYSLVFGSEKFEHLIGESCMATQVDCVLEIKCVLSCYWFIDIDYLLDSCYLCVSHPSHTVLCVCVLCVDSIGNGESKAVNLSSN